jgi:hypothetical protein
VAKGVVDVNLKWLFWLALLSCGLVVMESSGTSGAAAYSNLSGQIKAQQISKVSLIHRPSNIETPVQIDETALRQFAETRVILEKAGERGITRDLLSSLAELNGAKASNKHDTRWGILLYDPLGTERIAIFLDSSGKFIKVRGEWFAVRGETMAWVRRSLKEALK